MLEQTDKDLRLSEYVILYFDILGYKENIIRLGEEGFLKDINSIVALTIKRIQKKYLFPEGEVNFAYKMFSDNMLIALRIPEKGLNYARLFNDKTNFKLLFTSLLIEEAGFLQREFIVKHNIFIRGCITTGRLFIDKDYLYGTGLIKAYLLENDRAIYPRILIDNTIFRGATSEELKFNRLERGLISCGDEYLFIDYLNISCGIRIYQNITKNDIEKQQKEQNDYKNKVYEKHRECIEHLLFVYKDKEKVFNKYCWCAKYHNMKCKQENLDYFISE